MLGFISTVSALVRKSPTTWYNTSCYAPRPARCRPLTRRCWRRGALPSLVCALLTGAPADAATIDLASGEMHLIRPRQSVCFTQINGDGFLTTAETECSASSGTADLRVESTSPFDVDVNATVRFVTTFRVEPVAAAAQQSFLPIFVRVPNLRWSARLFNASRSGSPSVAQFSVNMRLTELLGGRADARDFLVDSAIFDATHAGSGNCGRFVKSPAAVALSAVKCLLESVQRHDGRGVATISSMVQPDRLYTIEIEVVARVKKELIGREAGEQVESSSVFLRDDSPALQWGRMFITIGTDPQTVVAPHKHEYKTGRGKGHNNVDVDTSLPIAP